MEGGMLEAIRPQRIDDVDVRVDAALLALESHDDDDDVDQGADQAETVAEDEQQDQRRQRRRQKKLLPPRAQQWNAKNAKSGREGRHRRRPERRHHPRRAFGKRPDADGGVGTSMNEYEETQQDALHFSSAWSWLPTS
jgi:hypothetical protein